MVTIQCGKIQKIALLFVKFSRYSYLRTLFTMKLDTLTHNLEIAIGYSRTGCNPKRVITDNLFGVTFLVF